MLSLCWNSNCLHYASNDSSIITSALACTYGWIVSQHDMAMQAQTKESEDTP